MVGLPTMKIVMNGTIFCYRLCWLQLNDRNVTCGLQRSSASQNRNWLRTIATDIMPWSRVARRGLTQAALRQAGEFVTGGMLENECE